MPRLRRFVLSLASSYAVLLAGVIHTLASVPLALHYLGAEEFGLWALLMQITAYLAIIDMGMSASVSRLLIDYKDKPNEGIYGSLIQTGWTVSFIQGLIVLALSLLLAPILVDLLAIPSHLRQTFVTLLGWQSAVVAGSFFTRIFNHLLFAHQRFDVPNYAGVVGAIANFAVLWIGFSKNWGLNAMIAATAVGWVIGATINASACVHFRLFPNRGTWGKPTWERFVETFNYGKDIFLVTMGSQLLAATPTIILSRAVGLEAVAVWSVCTKAFNLLCLVVWRIFDMSLPAFSEMFARGEHERLHKRFRDLTALTMSLSGAAAVMLAISNQSFVAIWTQDRIAWNPWNDVILGVALMVHALSHCHNGMILVSKRIQAMRYIYIVEAAVFILLAGTFASQGGFIWILLCLHGCAVGLSGAYLIRRSMTEFGESCHSLLIEWQRPMLKMLLVLVPLATLVFGISQRWPHEARLAAALILCGIPAAVLFVRWGVPPALQAELTARAPGFLNPLLAILFRKQPAP